MENVKNNLFGIFALFTNLGLRNIIFAAILSFCSKCNKQFKRLYF